MSEETYISPAGNSDVEQCKERIAHALNLLEHAVEVGKTVCEKNGWDDGVFYQVEESAQKLGFALATLIRWDADLDD